MFSRVVFHNIILIIICRQLLNFETSWFRTADLRSLSSLLLFLMIILKVYLVVTVLWNATAVYRLYLLLIHIVGIYILRIVNICLPLSRMYHSTSLYLCLLPGAGSSTPNSDCILITSEWLRVKVVTSTWECWQHVLIGIFKWFINFRHHIIIIISLGLEMVHNTLVLVACWCLPTYLRGHLIILLHNHLLFLLLFDMWT